MELLGCQNMSTTQFWGENSQYTSPPKEQDIEDMPLQEGTPLANTSKKRTKNFTEKEDKHLVSSWLEISMDSAQGIEQKGGTYWERIHDHFHKYKTFNSERSPNSLTHRWQTILESVNRFCECYAQIENRNQSGMTKNDRVIQVCELYKERDKKKRLFVLLHCWNKLRFKQKWLDRCSSQKQKVAANASSTTSTPGINESHHDEEGECHTLPQKDARSVGRKKEKERQRRGKSALSPGETLYMDALQNMFAKKKEVEDRKEMKRKERDEMFLALEQKRLDEEMAMERKKHEERMVLEKQKFEEQKAGENKKIKLQERELDLKQRLEDDKVMNMDLSGMNELQQQYYRSMQREIIARRFGEGSS